MATVFDVAAYILETCGDMSAMKLQKLCYYSQAWAISWTEKTLFDEDFEAWNNGPVCPALFHEPQGRFMVSYSDITQGNPDNLTTDEKDTINVVLRDYAEMSPYELRELSHSEEPYIIARNGLPDGIPCNNVLSKSSMGTFYGSL